ncbi:MAG: GNAT family N-acetyltransferase [Candidatus Lokiarchaeota archaeon]|nr:GNAT family N-acetyltransferase [Candidatus Lokiarchaeota archaeon]
MAKKNKFIGQFVDEMYGVIIGLGIANILFQEAFEPSSVLQIFTIFIITYVILTYWWDWAEYVSTEVYSTKRELIIDFMILFVMELFYVFYSNLLYLAIAFCVLGICDFIWVSNFIYETRREGDFSIRPVIYLLEKLICISIYISSFIFCLYLENQILIKDFAELNKWIQSFSVLIAFLMVRKVGFNHIRGEKFFFFPAEIEDAKDIIDINESYLRQYNNKLGFLLGKLDYNELLEIIRCDHKTFFVAKGEDKEFLGYVKIDEHIEDDILKDVKWNWIDKNNKNDFERFQYIYISQLAIKKESSRKGIGKFIYETLFKKYPDRNFVAFVAKEPYLNRASREFHESLGFDKVGIFKRKRYLEVDNFESYFFYKEKLIEPKKMPFLKKIHNEIKKD